MKNLKYSFFAILFLFAGCASVVAPQTPQQSLYYAAATIQSVSTSLLQSADNFTPEQAEQIADSLQEATEAVNSARVYLSIYDKTGAPDAEDEAIRRIQQAQIIVNALQSILRETQ